MTAEDLPRPDVPTAVAVVRDFVNTTDHQTGSDDLTTTAELSAYLFREGLMPRRSRATDGDLALALTLRAGLRSALEVNHDGTGEALPTLAQALRDLPIGLIWAGGRPALEATAPGVRGAMAGIGLAAHEAATAGTWWRLKICAADDCAWAYYDHSKNRSRNWCEYGCGNKVKTRAYRARQRSGIE